MPELTELKKSIAELENNKGDKNASASDSDSDVSSYFNIFI